MRNIISLLFLCFIISIAEYAEAKSIDTIIQDAMPKKANDGDFFQTDPGTGNRVIKVELDMLFTEEDYAALQAGLIPWNETQTDGTTGGRKKRKATRPASKRWTSNEIPYHIVNQHFNAYEQRIIKQGIAEWNSMTCVQMRPWKAGDRNYIQIQNGGGCSSYVGMVGNGRQIVSLGRGCRYKRIVVHELGHAVGFQHEQTRPDRNNYVTVYRQNIVRGMEFNFDHYSTRVVNTYGVPYDYGSVMHYGATAFSRNGQITISTKDSRWQRAIGNAPGLSFADTKMANLMYNCGSRCSKKTCPGGGFVDKHCRCMCKGPSAADPVKQCTGDEGDDDDDDDEDDNKCIDSNTSCAQWAQGGYCDKTPAYMKTNCKKSCNLCDGGGGGGGNCIDDHTSCSSWATRGECTNNPGYMNVNCKKSCNKCTGGGGGKKCKDDNDNCASWAKIGECTKNPGYMNVNCKQSCNKCTGGGGGKACIDVNTSCPSWISYCSIDSYKRYMATNCQKTCGLCSSSPTTGGTDASCVDDYTAIACASWKDAYCNRYDSNVPFGCRKTCGKC